jgi:hypothetical protein
MSAKTEAILRHLALALFTVLGTWATTELAPTVQDTPVYGSLIAGGIMVVLAWLTPLVNAYGVGAKPQINRNITKENV